MAPERSREAILSGALVGTYVADALGAGWEGAGAAAASEGPPRVARSLAAAPLTYTDDTQLAMALAEHLVEHPDVEPQLLADVFLDHYEPWRGYGAGMQRLVAHWRSGAGVEGAATTVFPDGSFGNGAAMRVAPVGACHAGDPDRVAEVAARQARITHAHPIGVDAAVAQALAVALAAEGGAFGLPELAQIAERCATDELRSALRLAGELPADTPLPAIAQQLGNEVLAHRSVPAALWLAAVADDYAHAVTLALALGGDADTIAAMAGAVLGAALSADAIPAAWLDALAHDEARGLDYARGLAVRLAGAGG